MKKFYASLVGPLLNVYYPLPFRNDTLNRIALNTSKLKDLWHAIYDEKKVNENILLFGGIKLNDTFINKLDWDSHEIMKTRTGMNEQKQFDKEYLP